MPKRSAKRTSMHAKQLNEESASIQPIRGWLISAALDLSSRTLAFLSNGVATAKQIVWRKTMRKIVKVLYFFKIHNTQMTFYNRSKM
jgi:hypothetical protein